MPNLGIFLDDFRNNTNNHSDFISKLNKNDEVEINISNIVNEVRKKIVKQ